MAGLSPVGVPKELANTAIPFQEGDLNRLEEILTGGDVAAIKMEVMRSEAPSNKYLSKIRKLADKFDAVLIFDECTSGFRETFGGLHLKYNIDPDLAVLGKTLGNGYAITTVLGTQKVMSASQNSFISSTFFTERIGYVAALATLNEMEKLKSWKIISHKGVAFKKKLLRISKKYKLELDISGMDALVSYNFKKIDALAAKTFISQEMLKEGFLAGNLFYPSIAHSNEDMKDFFISMEKVFKKLAQIIQNKENISNHLNGPSCHATFQRLN